MSTKKIQVWLPLLFSLTMIAGMYFGFTMRDAFPNKGFFSLEKRRPVAEIIDLIRNKYVDEVNIESLTDTAINAMLHKLDPHSVFIPADQLQAINENLAGKFYGIGVEFNIFEDTINVINVHKDSPGDHAGIMTGDKILKAGDSIVAGVKTTGEKIRKLLRGDRGSKVTLVLLRNGRILTVSVTRDAIPIKSVDAAYMMDSTNGYIRLNKFSTQTYREFMEALEGLKKKGLQKLILDLRDNGGGVLEEAVEIADEFLEGDKLITYTEGKHSVRKEYRCRRQGQFEKGTLVILEDEGSASASEVLMGALQDWDRATIIGRRSFGKGLVQEQFDLSDNSALRLTIARYYTPLGRSIQRAYSNGEKAYYDEITNRFHDGETLSADSVHADKGKSYKTRAGKTLYGSGGITPDYFVAFDTAGFNPANVTISVKGTLGTFAYQYFLHNQQRINAFRSPIDFNTNFQFNETDWNLFRTQLTKDSIPLTVMLPKEKERLAKNIKANIARLAWGTQGFFEVLNANDEGIKKAMEIFRQ